MSKDIVKNYGKSIRSKLLNIAKEENTFYQTYDLYTILHNEKYDATVLQEAIMRTF